MGIILTKLVEKRSVSKNRFPQRPAWSRSSAYRPKNLGSLMTLNYRFPNTQRACRSPKYALGMVFNVFSCHFCKRSGVEKYPEDDVCFYSSTVQLSKSYRIAEKVFEKFPGIERGQNRPTKIRKSEKI